VRCFPCACFLHETAAMPEARPTSGRVAILPLPRLSAGLAGSGPDNSRAPLHVDSPYKWGLLTILGCISALVACAGYLCVFSLASLQMLGCASCQLVFPPAPLRSMLASNYCRLPGLTTRYIRFRAPTTLFGLIDATPIQYASACCRPSLSQPEPVKIGFRQTTSDASSTAGEGFSRATTGRNRGTRALSTVISCQETWWLYTFEAMMCPFPRMGRPYPGRCDARARSTWAYSSARLATK
jgi:hypothetical protein